MFKKKYVTGIFRLYSVEIDLPEQQIKRLEDKHPNFVVKSVQKLVDRPLEQGEFNIYLLFELKFSLFRAFLHTLKTTLAMGGRAIRWIKRPKK
jgi:hypothetical protein